MTPGERLRQIANALNLSTLLGVMIARAASAPRNRGPRGLILASGYTWTMPKAAAFTVGNVVLFRAGTASAGTDPILLSHEERHSTQYAYCLGLPFLPLYLLCALWSLLRTGNPGTRNFFERQAGLAAGGYPDKRIPVRPTHQRNEARQ